MSYTIDIYRGKNTPYDNFLSFACYAAFFPQLVAGPIVRSEHFEKEIEKPIFFNSNQMKLGLTLIIYGITKKMLIADNLAIHVNEIFTHETPLHNIGLIWWGSFAFGIQIYCDFSAYTDIAIGSAMLFGIKLPENFDSPYAAKISSRLWRRWHISLSTWLRDYLYITRRKQKWNSSNDFRPNDYHDFGRIMAWSFWNFVLWGFCTAFYYWHRVITKIEIIQKIFIFAPKFASIIGWCITQYFVFMTWLVFRVEDTQILIPSLRTFVGIESYWDYDEMISSLPEIKMLTSVLDSYLL